MGWAGRQPTHSHRQPQNVTEARQHECALHHHHHHHHHHHQNQKEEAREKRRVRKGSKTLRQRALFDTIRSLSFLLFTRAPARPDPSGHANQRRLFFVWTWLVWRRRFGALRLKACMQRGPPLGYVARAHTRAPSRPARRIHNGPRVWGRRQVSGPSNQWPAPHHAPMGALPTHVPCGGRLVLGACGARR